MVNAAERLGVSPQFGTQRWTVSNPVAGGHCAATSAWDSRENLSVVKGFEKGATGCFKEADPPHDFKLLKDYRVPLETPAVFAR